jgi:hypothetical protein
MLAASSAGRWADDIIDANTHVFPHLCLVAWAPAINELKPVDSVLNGIGKALHHFWVMPEVVRQDVRQDNADGKDLRAFSNATRHLSFSSMRGGAA